MITAPLALAFTAGMVATVNPCGFAMLPAYLSYFVGLDSDDEVPAPTRIRRALLTASIVSVGFLIVFGLVGTLVTLGARSIIGYVPWISIGIGAALAALGVAMLMGYRLKVGLPKLDRGGDTRSFRSVFLFGISYAVASLSCTLPVFLAIVSGTVTRENFASGLATSVAYAAGMSVILFTLALAVAAANHSIVGALRRASQHVDRAAGVLLIVAGTYIVYYWSWAQITGATTTTTGAGPITFVANMSSRATEFIQTYQNLIVALFLVTVVGAVVFVLQAGDTDSEGDSDISGPDADPATGAHSSTPTDSLQGTGPTAPTTQESTNTEHPVSALAHSSSRRTRRARSSTLKPSTSPRSTRSCFTHFPRVPGCNPKSRAKRAIGLPVSRAIRTAPSRIKGHPDRCIETSPAGLTRGPGAGPASCRTSRRAPPTPGTPPYGEHHARPSGRR